MHSFKLRLQLAPTLPHALLMSAPNNWNSFQRRTNVSHYSITLDCCLTRCHERSVNMFFISSDDDDDDDDVSSVYTRPLHWPSTAPLWRLCNACRCFMKNKPAAIWGVVSELRKGLQSVCEETDLC